MIGMRLEGSGAVKAALADAAARVQKKATRAAVSAATKPVLSAARSIVRVGAADDPNAGLLKKSLGRKVKVFRGSGVAVGIVGPRRGFKMEKRPDGSKVRVQTKFSRYLGQKVKKGKLVDVYKNPTQYGHLVNKGTKRSRAFPFMEPALAAARPQVMRLMADAAREVVEGQGGGGE